MGDWTIINQGAAGTIGVQPIRTFEQLGITAPRRSLTNAGIDTFSFIADGRAHDIEPLFAYGSRLRIIHPDGQGWFQGIVTTLPRFTDGGADRQVYEVAGPMWQLQQNVYKLIWPGVDPTGYSSHLLLHYSGNGLLETTQLTVQHVLDYVLSIYPAGAKPFQYSLADILPGMTAVYPPVDEVRDILCSEVLRMCMRWHPRSVLWFDYSTNPPTLKLTPQASLTRVSFAGGNGLPASRISAMNLVPRYDLIRPSVAITYEITSVVDGENRLSWTRDIAPVGATGLEEGARNLSLDLRGRTVNNLSAYIETTPILTSDLEWWKGHIPALKNSTIYKNLSIKAGSVSRKGAREQGVEVPTLNLPNEVTSKGQFPGWLKDTGVQVQRERVLCMLTYDLYASDGVTILHHGEMPQSVSITATDAETGTFSTVSESESGDPIPIGLAAFLLDEINDLQWQADFVFTDQEVGGTVKPGTLVNIIGSRPEFGTMDAVVQSVDEDIANGTSTVRCSPLPPHELGDMLELIKVTRPRLRYTSKRTFDDGDISDGLELGEETADENGILGSSAKTLSTVLDETSGKKVTLDAGKGANGAPSPANLTRHQTAGAAHVTVESGLGKTFHANASDGGIYHSHGVNVLDAQLAAIAGQGPVTYQPTKICVDVGGGVIKQRTCIVLRGPAYKAADDPT